MSVMASSTQRDVYLVIGGSGFLGRHIVQKLLERGDPVAVFDVVQRYHDTPFYSGDICDKDALVHVLQKTGTTCIIHTASPHAQINNPGLFFKVNVEGTKTVIAAAEDVGVTKLVYTSSAGVVFNGGDLMDIDERLSYPEKPFDSYNESKAKGEEAVLEANGKNGLYTVALRPAGIFGPGDQQLCQGLWEAFLDNKTNIQIGPNTNLFDYTYVGNVAKAHLLAADKLLDPLPSEPLGDFEKVPEEPPSLSEKEAAMTSYRLPPIDLTSGPSRIPSSDARPIGPSPNPPPNAAELEKEYYEQTGPISSHPISRTKFDQLSFPSLSRAKLHKPYVGPLQVAGQAFFITNGEPIYWRDMAKMVWSYMFEWFPERKAKQGRQWELSKDTGMFIASIMEAVGWITGKRPVLTRFRVAFMTATRWHNIEKARRVLGYEPEVGMEEGVARMMEWFKADVVDKKVHEK